MKSLLMGILLLTTAAYAKEPKAPGTCSICLHSDIPCKGSEKPYQIDIQPGLSLKELQDDINTLTALYNAHENIRKDQKCSRNYQEAIRRLHEAAKAQSEPVI